MEPPAYFGIGNSGQGPYESQMLCGKPRRLLRAYAVLGCGLCLAACSRSSSEQAEPSASAAAPSSPLALLRAGAPAPDVGFDLQTGEHITLASLRGKPVVVYFYPKDDTPGCTLEAQEIRDLYAELQRTGAVVIGVSTDGRDSHRAFAEKHALPFLLASDQTGELARAFGVPLKNGRASRVSFVIDAQGRVLRVFPRVTPQGHAAELLAALPR